MVPGPAISVMPQSSMSGQPARRSNSSILAAGMVWPPTVQRVREERSKRSNSGWASMYMNIVGTPSKRVARCSSMAAITSAASKDGSSTRVMP